MCLSTIFKLKGGLILGATYSTYGGLLRVVNHNTVGLDFNACESGTITVFPNSGTMQNAPYGTEYRYIIITLGWGADRIAQVAFCIDNGKLATRFFNGASWSSWVTT